MNQEAYEGKLVHDRYWYLVNMAKQGSLQERKMALKMLDNLSKEVDKKNMIKKLKKF
tara:strand:- start:3572 stop:3742 length:171 start_codon:yes stop_codon:yes gene_type:complete